MNKNTSITLGMHFDSFVKNSIAQGRFNNASEVVRAGLRLLEAEENRVMALKKAIQEGVDSGVAHDFDSKENLKQLKAQRNNANL